MSDSINCIETKKVMYCICNRKYSSLILLIYLCSEKDFVAIVDLPEGRHEYKFMVDGEWKLNGNEAICSSDLGTENNTITISDSDFEEFENALLRDPNDKSSDQKAKLAAAGNLTPGGREKEGMSVGGHDCRFC